MMSWQLVVSPRKDKKLLAVSPDGFKIHFGASGYADYTTHKDEKRKMQYMERHKKEDWTDLYKAGTWARFILWNKKTLSDSIRDMENKFGIKIYKL